MQRRELLASIGIVGVAGCVERLPIIGGSPEKTVDGFINSAMGSDFDQANDHAHVDKRNTDEFTDFIERVSEGDFDLVSVEELLLAEDTEITEVFTEDSLSSADSIQDLGEITAVSSVEAELVEHLDGEEFPETISFDLINHDGWYIWDFDDI